MSDGIIGSVAVAIVPDATAFWDRFRAQTSAGAAEAGRKAGNDWQRGFDAATRGTSVKVGADTSKARAEIAALNKETGRSDDLMGRLVKTAITLSPALVPIGAAAVAGGVSLAAFGAAGILAFKGLKNEAKAVTPLGLQISGMLHQVKSEVTGLQVTALHGVLPGFERTVKTLRGELPKLNSDISTQSALLGDTASHLATGLVGGLHTFAPLLDQVGKSADRIAFKFESWATGPGGTKFGHTLAQDYARVVPVVDDIARSVEHLIVAAHPVGLGILTELQLLSRVVSAFPTPVLEAMVAAFVSARTLQSLQGVFTAVGAGYTKMTASVVTGSSVAAAAQEEYAAITAAAQAQVASEVAASQLAQAQSVASAQAEIAASLAGTGSIFEASAAAAAAASAEEIVAFEAAATAAAATAGEMAAAAEEAAASSAAAAEASGIAWSSMLGPVGIAVGAVALLGLTFLNTSNDNQQATQALQDYTSALEQSSGVINETVRAQLAGNKTLLGDVGELSKAGLTLSGVVNDIVKTTSQQTGDVFSQGLQKQLQAAYDSGKITRREFYDLLTDIHAQGTAFYDAIGAARAYQAAMVSGGQATDYMATQISNGNTALRDYVVAVDAFNKSADTAADRAKLIGSVLVASQGDLLGYANTMVAAATANQQMVTDLANVKKGVIDLKTGTIDYHNAAAAPLISDLQQLQTAAEGAASATYQHELRTKGAKKAADDAFLVYKNDTKGALVDEAKQLGLTSGQAKKLGDRYFGIKNSGDIKKRIELIGEDKVVQALQGILEDLDLLVGKTTILDVQINRANRDAAAPVGTKSGPDRAFASGTGAGGLPEGFSWVGDPGPQSELVHKRGSHVDVLSHGQSVAFANQMGMKVPTFAGGTGPGGFDGVVYGKGGVNKYGQQKNPSSAAAGMSGSVFASFVQAVLGSVTNPITSAFDQMISSIRSSGGKLAASFVDYLRGENAQLRRVSAERDRIAARIQAAQGEISNVQGTVQGTFDITQAGQNSLGEPVTLFDIQSALKTDLGNAKTFERVLKRLAREGLNKHLIAQLAEAGPGALGQAQALLSATPKQITAINAEYRQLGKVGNQVGEISARALYGAGISAGDGLIQGLRSKENALTKTMRHLADVMIGQLRSDLQMHSPSRRLFNEAALAFEGYALGAESQAGRVQQAASMIAAKSIPNRPSYSWPGLGSAAGPGGGFHYEPHYVNSLPETAGRSQSRDLRNVRELLGR